MSPEEVYYELVNRKFCDPIHITPKPSAEFISGPLSQLFNHSMPPETLPIDWTTANIVPVYKKLSKEILTNQLNIHCGQGNGKSFVQTISICSRKVLTYQR